MLTGSEIRRKFLDFFNQKGHREVHSSSLVPQNDPTLLFTNAGMNQFKDVFLGLEKRDYSRATTSQKCVRAGGKHNDLENVGFTNRHHTFFEMLGNFSFGDYFKKDAIAYAWELITSPEWFGIDKAKLYVTIFKGENGVPRDAEAYDLWLGQNVPKDRIYEFGAKDNFWQMGDTGPCGPCSEIHYDMGVAASDQGHTDCTFGCDCGRYVELWNLVFMQFDRDASGKLNPLPKPSIDTGAGLERMASVMQGVISNYETDLFVPLIKKAAQVTGVKPQIRWQAAIGGPGVSGTLLTHSPQLDETMEVRDLLRKPSLRIIADHARAVTFLISDGVLPSNEGRGYVLRKILRRAIRHGRLLGQEKPFLFEMVYAVHDLMKDAYPELIDSADGVAKVVNTEEQQFARVLAEGSRRLDMEVAKLIRPLAHKYEKEFRDAARGEDEDIERLFQELDSNDPSRAVRFFTTNWAVTNWEKQFGGNALVFAGEKAFHLYETFGLPLDFMVDAARDAGVTFDEAGFEAARAEEQARARASWKGAAKQTANPAYQELAAGARAVVRGIEVDVAGDGVFRHPLSGRLNSKFVGYEATTSRDCLIVAIIRGGAPVRELKPGDSGEIILDHTPFYAESGGQVGDRGWLYSNDHNTVVAEVTGCYYPVQGVRAHQVVVKNPPSAKNAEGWGTLRVGDKVDAVVDTAIRESTMRNHTATHLLQAGLREVLGKHVKQAGSLVAPNHLRFDFSHFTGVAEEELQDIEDLINKEVLRNERVEIIENVPIDVAVNEYHAMALFGEKYGDKVRVIKIGDFSTELCGGTHTAQTGEIGLIKILKEGSVSSGVRRIEAVTGEGSLRHFRRDHELEGVVASLVGPTLAQKTRKDGVPGSKDGTPATGDELASPAEALKLELKKKDAEIKRLTRELDQARMKSASSSTANIGETVKEVRGVKVLAHRVDNLERAQMRTLVDQLRDKLGSAVIVLGSASNGNVSLIVGVTKDLTGRIQAGKVIGPVAEKVGGKGGGRPDLAEAGGKDAAALDSALGEVYRVVESLLG
jgi:alanyl-tRNA synthetase